MSTSICNTPKKRSLRLKQGSNFMLKNNENNNNKSIKNSERCSARDFVNWFRNLVDNERQNLVLYLADEVILEWFGRTIRTRKKVTAFLKFDMQCSKHDFQSIESVEAVQTRQDIQRKCNEAAKKASPFSSPEMIRSSLNPKKRLRSRCLSPEWDPEVLKSRERKRRNSSNDYETIEVDNKGDCVPLKKKCMLVTPPSCERGQGDCLPSTSGTADSMTEKSHAALNSQLPKKAVECNGYVQFIRTRNSRSVDFMPWERKCKVQISYSEDPLNIGEYILWSIHYSDDSKCRRNLLAAFEEVSPEESKI